MFKNLVNYIKLRNAMTETTNIINNLWVAGNKKEYQHYVRRWNLINQKLGNKYVLDTITGYETFGDYLKASES